MNNKPISHILAFAGTIPFVVGTMLIVFGVKTLPLAGEVATIINAYGLAIVAFMAGCQWGVHVLCDDTWASKLPLASNVVTLIAWFAYLLCSVRISFIVMTCCFLVLLIIDAMLKNANIISKEYYQLRCWVSKIVIASLCVASVFAG